MLVISSKPGQRDDTHTHHPDIAESYLKHIVEQIAIPRHYVAETENNYRVREWIRDEFDTLGMQSFYQGKYNNIIATYQGISVSECKIVIGAHYDSVPGSPGADDNASAVAGVLAAAKALQAYTPLPILFVAFNREEDGLLGSEDFVRSIASQMDIQAVHILEMIGFASDRHGSQKVPEGLPVKVSNVGDFIAVIANRHSNHLIKPLVNLSERHLPQLPLKALKVFFGVEKFFPHLSRSDHAPFWESDIPALMWTDTSEFRNPNYHLPSDTPDTLDYTFMKKVVTLLTLSTLDILQKTEN